MIDSKKLKRLSNYVNELGISRQRAHQLKSEAEFVGNDTSIFDVSVYRCKIRGEVVEVVKIDDEYFVINQ